MVHWNVYGYRGGSGPNFQATAAVKYMITGSSPRPTSISLNEVCDRIQGRTLIDYLYSLGYSSAHHYGHFVDETCGWFGNIVFVRAPLTGWVWAGNHFARSEGGRRSWVCVDAHGFVTGAFCSTHMSLDAASRASNLDEYRQVAQWLGALVIAGDFNASPDEEGVNEYWFHGLREASGGPPASHVPTWHSYWGWDMARLDYIWVNDFIFDPYTYFLTDLWPYSDHFFYELRI